jgi:hypothetical protein
MEALDIRSLGRPKETLEIQPRTRADELAELSDEELAELEAAVAARMLSPDHDPADSSTRQPTSGRGLPAPTSSNVSRVG